jgi:hypothetical protein
MIVNVMDTGLPSLASDAAVELDLLINGEQTELDAVRPLGDCWRRTRDKPAADQPARGLQVDTETETILGQAFAQAGDNPSTILGELLRRTEEIAEHLSSAGVSTEPETLERQRAFCLALSQSAAAYRQSIFDVRPPHPYRK